MMTNTPTTPPNVVEQWNKEFEQEITLRHSHLSLNRTKLARYSDNAVEALWQGFLLGRQTVCIKVPEKTSSAEESAEYGAEFCGGYYAAVLYCEISIKSQGYQIKVAHD